MKPIEELIEAFQQHYSSRETTLRYTAMQHAELCKKYGWFSSRYADVVYDEVVSTHPMSLRSLPDIALISTAVSHLDEPAVYHGPVNQIEDHSAETHELVDECLANRAKEEGEPNHEEREKIRKKVALGRATKEEVFWITCIDKYNGNWARAMSASGEKILGGER